MSYGVAEVIVRIAYEADADPNLHGIAKGAPTLVDDTYYVRGNAPLSAVADDLRQIADRLDGGLE